MLPNLEEYACDTQFGGCKGKGTAFCSHLYPLAWTYAASSGLSFCAFFLDAIAAFESVIRQFVMSDQDLDEKTIAALRTLGFSEEVMHELANHISEVSALIESGATVHLVRMVCEVHDGSWFSVQGTRSVTATCLGSKPGDPLGDIIFNFLAAKCLKCVYCEASDAGLMHSLPAAPVEVQGHPANDSVYLFDSNHMDDSVFFLFDACAKNLVQKCMRLVSICVTVFTRHGLRLNFKSDKSEVMFKFRGSGKMEVMRTLHKDTSSILQVIVPAIGAGSDTTVDVRIVRQYKHMGGIHSNDGKYSNEVSNRNKSAYDAFIPLRSRALRSKDIEEHTKYMLAQSLVFSRLFYNVCTWPRLPVAVLSKLNATSMKVLRSVSGKQNTIDNPVRWSDLQVRVSLDAPAIEAVLRRCRVRYLCKLLTNAPAVVIRLVVLLRNARDSWPFLVMEDLADIRNSEQELFESMPCPLIDSAKWFNDIISDPVKWSRKLSRVAMQSFRSRHRLGEETSLAPELLAHVQCPLCPKIYATIQQLRTHCCNVHSMYNPMQSRVYGTICVACGTQFHSFKRVTKHLMQRSERNRCHQYYLEHVLPVDSTELKEILEKRIVTDNAVDKKLVPPPPVKLH